MRNTKAFTFIELMVAVAVLAGALLAVLGVFTGCFGLNESSKNLTIAVSHARCVMEEIRDCNILAIITAQDWTSWAQTDPPGGGACDSLENESIQVTYPSGAGANPLEILLTVNWTERGRAKSIQLVTLLAER
jgi:prepilin-type N-terminal cleavage/methylation domain-containing protein